MNTRKPSFQKFVIGVVENPTQPGAMNTFSAVGDVNGDGLPDVVVCGRHGRMVWLENPGKITGNWNIHLIDETDKMECGGSLWDLTGNGLKDVINGSEGSFDEMYWWENPGRADARWMKRLIAKTGHKQMHDTIIGDVTGDGKSSLIFTNQGGGTFVYRVELPANPRQSPWPDLEVIASEKRVPNAKNPWNPEGYQPEEGLAIGDLDGDGVNELVCGTHWYKRVGPGKWECHQFAPPTYLSTKCAVADIDGDGKNEILLTEGDPVVYGKKEGGKFSWFKPGVALEDLWEEHVIEDGLLDAHSLQVGDILGNGKLDVMIGEIGVGGKNMEGYPTHPPRILVFENDGRANFTRHVVDEGTGIHDAVLVDMWKRGKLDIVGKPLNGPEKWQVHVYANMG
jgi:hypothetical protein